MFKKVFFLITVIVLSLSGYLSFPSEVYADFPGVFELKASTNFYKGCDNLFEIRVNTGGKFSNAADIRINFDPTKVEILDQDPGAAGVQIGKGSAYENYFGNIVDTNSGIIRMAGASLGTPFNGYGTFGYIKFRTKGITNSASFKIAFDGQGSTLDSNIAEDGTNSDLLGSVVDGTYSFYDGDCYGDKIPPVIIFDYPQDLMIDVPADSDVKIQITDNKSGVDLNSVVIIINGKPYENLDVGFSYLGDKNSYFIIIDPAFNFPTVGLSVILVEVSDFSGNATTATIIFNVYREVKQPLCGDTCTQSGDCPYNHFCDRGICKIPCCVGKDDCTCTYVEELPETGDKECGEKTSVFFDREDFCFWLLPLILIIIIIFLLIYIYRLKTKEKKGKENNNYYPLKTEKSFLK